jgi:hypothetical protein
MAGHPKSQPSDEHPSTGHPWTRRAVLLGGLGAGIGAAASTAGAGPAAASSDVMYYGAIQHAGDSFTGLASTNETVTLLVSNSSPGTGSERTPWSVGALASSGTAVYANAGIGAAVEATATSGIGVVAGSSSGAALLFRGGLGGPPTTGGWRAGSLIFTTPGELWICVASGTPGTWRRISGPSSAGDYVPVTPTRVFDSRRALPGPVALIQPGTPRVVSVADGRNLTTGAVTEPNLVPVGTRAIAANVTVTGTTGPGWIAVAPGDAAAVTASSVNYNGAGQSVANGLSLTLDNARRVKIFCATSATHVVIDVSGYYRSA